MKIKEIIRHLESKAPSETAERWDNVGLLVGDPGADTSGAIICIDLTAEAIEAAKKKKFSLIINHHPCIFPRGQGLSKVISQGADLSPLIYRAIQEGISVASYHTNFDQCALEVTQKFAEGMEITPLGRLLDAPSGSLTKLVVFVPESHAEAVRTAIGEAGAGHIGNYDRCTFGVVGEGTFRGLEGANPFIGTPGKLETAPEVRIETVFPKGLEKQVITAMKASHPYEEVAYDLYQVLQAPAEGGLTRALGYGIWGDFLEPKPFAEVTQRVKRLFDSTGFWVTNPPPKTVKRVGFVAGKGASFIGAAAARGCDLFITGEAGYHSALEGARRGLAVMELGHRESEKFFPPTVAAWLKELGLKAEELDVPMQKIY